MNNHGVSMRHEQAIFNDLANLCASPGYVHAIAYLCFRDNMTLYSGKMKAKDTAHLYSRKRLSRNEISTLIGLLIKRDIDYSLPTPQKIKLYVNETEALFEELHCAMSSPLLAQFDSSNILDKDLSPLTSGDTLREAFFYWGESAYSFQYRDFSPVKYENDNPWLIANKGFSIQDARNVVYSVARLRNEKAGSMLCLMQSGSLSSMQFLYGNIFSLQDVVDESHIDTITVKHVLESFTVKPSEYNDQFNSLHDFNIVNACPLMLTTDGSYILFDIYSFSEALYESPFYWMGADETYVDIAMRNRGVFTEQFAVKQLAKVFGASNVFCNIEIVDSRGNTLGEIDVLVLFGNRALVLQAKSKRLTLEARRGNDRKIQDDFKKSIQDSSDQACHCAQLLAQGSCSFKDAAGTSVQLPSSLKRIYTICLIADHYPALSFQAREFLKYAPTTNISAPFVMDVFTLDAMTEMLDSPLHLMSYIDRRTYYTDKLMASSELTILSYHLKQNLWMPDEYNLIQLSGEISIDLDLAMYARREGLPGKSTPDGILTRFSSTALGRMVKAIENNPDPATIDLGFILLTLGEESVTYISNFIDQISREAFADGKNHDFTVALGQIETGLTIHCNNDPIEVARLRLELHCKARKHTARAKSWLGVCLRPIDQTLRFVINLEFPWEQNDEMDLLTKDMSKSTQISPLLLQTGRRTEKVGRNAPCPCGSGKKYKQCCLS